MIIKHSHPPYCRFQPRFNFYFEMFLARKDPEIQKKAEAFRQGNKSWLRIGALLLIALMSVNIYLHIVALIDW